MCSNFLNCAVTGKTHIKVQYFQVKVIFSCEFNIPGVIAFYAFLWPWKSHYPVDSDICLSYNQPLWCCGGTFAF